MLGSDILRPVTDSGRLRRRATYDDLLKVPEPFVAEIVDGVLYASPRPALPHALAASTLDKRLAGFHHGGDGPGGWWILYEPELHFDDDVVVPDLAGWRTERMPDAPHGSFATLAPDWLCEVLSASTVRLDRKKKLRVYAREGVSHVWLIDPRPRRRTLEVLTRDQSDWTLRATYRDHDRVRAAPFDAVAIELAYLWGETPARAAR